MSACSSVPWQTWLVIQVYSFGLLCVVSYCNWKCEWQQFNVCVFFFFSFLQFAWNQTYFGRIRHFKVTDLISPTKFHRQEEVCHVDGWNTALALPTCLAAPGLVLELGVRVGSVGLGRVLFSGIALACWERVQTNKGPVDCHQAVVPLKEWAITNWPSLLVRDVETKWGKWLFVYLTSASHRETLYRPRIRKSTESVKLGSWGSVAAFERLSQKGLAQIAWNWAHVFYLNFDPVVNLGIWGRWLFIVK